MALFPMIATQAMASEMDADLVVICNCIGENDEKSWFAVCETVGIMAQEAGISPRGRVVIVPPVSYPSGEAERIAVIALDSQHHLEVILAVHPNAVPF
jgi:hypothetical protein